MTEEQMLHMANIKECARDLLHHLNKLMPGVHPRLPLLSALNLLFQSDERSTFVERCINEVLFEEGIS